MTEIISFLKLGFFKRHNPILCKYCNGKLQFAEYEADIKVKKLKTPPIGADDLNIYLIKSIMYSEYYAICTKCNANYLLKPLYYGKYTKYKSNSCYEQSLSQFNQLFNSEDDFKSKVSEIRDKYDRSGAIVTSSIKIKHDIPDIKLNFINNLILLIKKWLKYLTRLLSFK